MKRGNGSNGNKVGLADGIVVVLIVLVLGAILRPVFVQTHGCYRDSWQVRSLRNLKQIGTALMMYTQDYDERLPPLPNAAVAKRLLYPYLKNEALFREPRNGRAYGVNRALSGEKWSRFAKTAARVVVFYEVLPDEYGGRNVTFLDGHVKWVGAATWAELKAGSKMPMTSTEYLAALRAADERENRLRLPILDRRVNAWDVFVFVVQVLLPALFFRVFASRRPARP